MKPRPVRKKLVEVRKRYDPIKKTIIKSHPKVPARAPPGIIEGVMTLSASGPAIIMEMGDDIEAIRARVAKTLP